MASESQTIFARTCGGCRVQADEDFAECLRCVERNIYQDKDFPACTVCKEPMSGDSCEICAQESFGGAATYLDALGVAGYGKAKTGNSSWRQLGSAVTGFKGRKYKHFGFALDTLFFYKLRTFVKSVGRHFDYVTLVPPSPSNELLPRLFEFIEINVGTALKLSGTFDAHLLARADQQRQGPKAVAPWVRWRQLRDAGEDGYYFVAKDVDLAGKRILLLDDVYKSGCSMNFCAMKLKEAGADEVVGFALCRWPWVEEPPIGP